MAYVLWNLGALMFAVTGHLPFIIMWWGISALYFNDASIRSQYIGTFVLIATAVVAVLHLASGKPIFPQ